MDVPKHDEGRGESKEGCGKEGERGRNQKKSSTLQSNKIARFHTNAPKSTKLFTYYANGNFPYCTQHYNFDRLHGDCALQLSF
jgi:hypothetical protein